MKYGTCSISVYVGVLYDVRPHVSCTLYAVRPFAEFKQYTCILSTTALLLVTQFLFELETDCASYLQEGYNI